MRRDSGAPSALGRTFARTGCGAYRQVKRGLMQQLLTGDIARPDAAAPHLTITAP